MKRLIFWTSYGALMALLFLYGLARAQEPAAAPAPSNLHDLVKWVGTQQAHVGTARGLEDSSSYATTWWDAVSYGQKGINVGAAGALDFLDLGPAVSAANGRSTRYGQAVTLHVGNVWNSLAANLPTSLAKHVHLVVLPNVTVAPLFLWPYRLPLNRWTWGKDFQVSVGYRFGGSP